MHSYYRSALPSGENAVVDAEAAALSRAGHRVTVVAARTDDLRDEGGYALRAAARVATGAGGDPTDEIRASDPDVVHVHNTFPNFGEGWLRKVRTPVVRTLHNFRTVCANGVLFRDGEVCEACLGRKIPWPALLHACYRGSVSSTLPVVAGITRRNLRSRWTDVDHLIALSPNAREKFVAAGAPREQMTVWPHFLPADRVPVGLREVDRHGVLFVGRVDRAKGVLELAHAWRGPTRLTIIGGGPELSNLRGARLDPSVTVLGQRARDFVAANMAEHAVLAFPSQSYEGAATPLVYLEAIAHGLPVAATGQSSVPSLVAEDGTGVAFGSTEELAAALSDGVALPTSADVRAAFDARYTEAAYLARATALYGRLIAESRDGE